MNKNNHHIYKAEQIDWEKLESVGISKSQIDKDEKHGPAPSGRGNQCHVH